MFKFIKKKEAVKIFKHAKKNYARYESEHVYTPSETELNNAPMGEFGTSTYTSPSKMNADLAHLYTLTSFERSKSNMKEALKDSFISTKAKEYALVPEAVSAKIYEQVKDDPDAVASYFEEVVDKTTGAKSLRMRVSAYQTYQTKEISTSLQMSNQTKSDIKGFYNELVKFAKREMQSDETSLSGHTFLEFVTDIDDTYQIANNFAEPGSVLEQYSEFADVPVPVLAMHAIISSGTIDLNKTGEVNKVKFKQLVKQLENDKLRNLVCEICGLQVEGNKAVPYENADYPERAQILRTMLPTFVRFEKQHSEMFELNAIYTKPEYKAAIEKLQAECEGYVVDAINNKTVPVNISSRLQEDAEKFVAEIDKENIRLGKRKSVDFVVSKQQLRDIKLVVKQLANNANIEIVKATIDHYSTQSVELTEEVNSVIDSLNLDPAERELVEKHIKRQFKPAKTVDCLEEYPHDFAVIASNAAMIAKKQASIVVKTAMEVASYGNLPEEEQKKLYDEIFARNNKEIEDLVDFNNNVLKLVQLKEDLRVWNHTMGQIKFQGLSAIQEVYDKRIKEIQHSKHKEISGYKLEKKEANTKISEQKNDLNTTYVDRAELYQKFFANRFDAKVRIYLKTLGYGGLKGLPLEEINKQIEISKKKILATPVTEKGDKGTITLDKMEELFVSEIFRIAKGDVKFRNKNRPQEQTNMEVAALQASLIDGYAKGEGAAAGIIADLRSELSGEKKISLDPAATKIVSDIKRCNADIATCERIIEEQTAIRDAAQRNIDNYEEDTALRIAKLDADKSVAVSEVRRVELIRDYQNILEHILDAEERLQSDFLTAPIPSHVSKSDAKGYIKDRDVYINEETAMIAAARKELEHIEQIAKDGYNLQLVINTNEQGAPQVDFQLISDPRREFEDVDEMGRRVENPQPKAEEEKQDDVPVFEEESDIVQFVDAVHHVSMIDRLLSEETQPQEKEELAKQLMLEIKFKNAGNYLEAARGSLEAIREQEQLRAYEIAIRQGEPGTEARTQFVAGCTQEYIGQQEIPEEELEAVTADASTRFDAIITSCQEAEKNRQAEAQSHQIPQPTNPEAGDSQVQAEPAQEQEKKSKAKSAAKLNYSIKGVEKAVKNLGRMIDILDAQIKKDKAAAKAAQAQAERERAERERQEAERQRAPQVDAEIQTPPVIDETNFLGPDTPPVVEEEEEKDNNNGNPPVVEERDIMKDALLRKAYLTTVHAELAAVVGTRDKEQTAALFKELDITIETESLKDKTPQEIVQILQDKGIPLDKQQKAITLQVSTIKNAGINENGQLVNDRGVLVENRLYARYVEGDPQVVAEEIEATTSKKKQKFVLRNLIIHALGKGVIDPETVKARSAELGELLTQNGYEITEENIDKLVTGELKKDDTPIIQGFNEKTRQDAQKNVPQQQRTAGN